MKGMGKRRSIVGAPARYVSARVKWHAAGKPERTDEEVARIYNEVCKPCTHFKQLKGDLGWCKLCQCNLNLGNTLNKIRWATEECPDDPPRWTSDVKMEKGVAPKERSAHAPRREISSVVILEGDTPEERLASHDEAILERRKKRQERGR